MEAVLEFVKFFFCEGQLLSDPALATKTGRWHERHRKAIAFLAPIILVQSVYWPYVIYHNKLHVFTETEKASSGIPNFYLTITMIFGSFSKLSPLWWRPRPFSHPDS